jgi:hypothetical protein
MLPEITVSALVTASHVWPPVVVLAILLPARRGLVSWPAFLVIGLLVCYGVQSLVNLASAYTPAELEAGASAPERFHQFMLQHLARSVLLSAAISIAPLYWLWRLLRKRPPPKASAS